MKSHNEQDVIQLFREHPHQRAWGYVRVSGKSQEDNESFEAQTQAIKRYCAQEALGEPLLIYEVASSTKPLFAFRLRGQAADTAGEDESPRPVFLYLLSLLSERPGNHLVVFRLDRLARNEIDQELILKNLWSAGAQVHSTAASEADILKMEEGTQDPQRAFFRKIMAAAAAYEASMIRMRMDGGMKVKAARGGYTGGGTPFGYRARNRELVVDRYEAGIVRVVFELRYRYQFTVQAVADYLNANKHADDSQSYNKRLVSRIIRRRALYEGRYQPPGANQIHDRPDLRVLDPAFSEEFPEHEPARTRCRNTYRGLPESADGQAEGGHGPFEVEGPPCPGGDEPHLDGPGGGEILGGEPGTDPGGGGCPESHGGGEIHRGASPEVPDAKQQHLTPAMPEEEHNHG